MINKTFLQDLGAKLDYQFDWTPWLTEAGDTISTQVTTPASGLTLVSSSHDGFVVTAWVTIDSGTPKGRLLELNCKITTAAGRIDERTIYIKASQL